MTVWSTLGSEWSWGKSLLVKSGILGIGFAVIFFAGWPQPPISDRDRSFLYHEPHNQKPVSSTIQATNVSILDSRHLSGTEREETSLQAAEATVLVDLNQGSRMELETLPGIGVTLADRIVSYRSIHGNFKRLDDLVNVSGIGEKRIKRLEPFVTLKARVGKRAS